MFETKKQLKKKIDLLEQRLLTQRCLYNGLEGQDNELKDQNRCLQIENGMLTSKMNDYINTYNDLKKENDIFKEQQKDLNELYIVARRVQESLIPKCQKLHSENEALIKENEELKNKELKDIEKICDGVNSELLDLCTKLSDENMLLIHKQPIIREDKPQPKEEKRDKYGIVSKFEENACSLCIYKEDTIANNAVCDNCSNVNDYDEYYSSK